jgi:hypothetical protein
LAPIAGGPSTWTTKLPGNDALYTLYADWIDDQHAMMVTSHGIAAIDLATGAYVDPRSGWGFELSAAPHPESSLGRPLAAILAPPAPLAISADGDFQRLVTEVATASNAQITGWGPMRLDGELVRVAWLAVNLDRGNPLTVNLIGDARGVTVVVATIGGFPPEPDDGTPAWGSAPDLQEVWGPVHLAHTMDLHDLRFGAKWIHGSQELVVATREHGKYVVVSDAWADHENNGHSIDTTRGGRGFAPGERPRLAGFKAESIQFAVAGPSKDPAVIAQTIHELPLKP